MRSRCVALSTVDCSSAKAWNREDSQTILDYGIGVFIVKVNILMNMRNVKCQKSSLEVNYDTLI